MNCYQLSIPTRSIHFLRVVLTALVLPGVLFLAVPAARAAGSPVIHTDAHKFGDTIPGIYQAGTPTPTETATPTETPPSSYPPPATPFVPYPPAETPILPIPPNPAYPGPGTPAPTLTLEPTLDLAVTPPTDATAAIPTIPAPEIESGPTSTFIPVPTIVILFPDNSLPAGLSQAARSSQPAEVVTENEESGLIRLARFVPLAFILLIWSLLGVWFYLSLRRLG
jgi:hypothetical protein